MSITPQDAQRDRLWCAAILNEDVEVINRITTRFIGMRDGTIPIPLWLIQIYEQMRERGSFRLSQDA